MRGDGYRRGAALEAIVLLGCSLVLALCTGKLNAEDPAQAALLPQVEGPELPLEGALRRQYDADMIAYAKELRNAREPGADEAVLRRLAALPGRAGRDAVIRHVRAAKDLRLMNLAVNLLAKRTDGVSLRFVCGPDGLGSMAAHEMDQWARNAISSANNPAVVPYLLEVAGDRRSKAIVIGVAVRLAAGLAPKDPRVAEAAFRAARDRRPEARYPGLEALGHVGTPEAVEFLLEAAEKDTDWYSRGSAYTGLANAKRFDLLPRLRALLAKEGSRDVRTEGDEAVKKLEQMEAEAKAKAPDQR